MLFGAWSYREEFPASMIFSLVGLVVILAAFMFTHMTVRDEGDVLAIRYGPLAVFGGRFRYADITNVEPSHSSAIDGWGIHWIPGRGWTYNLWGFQCVKLRVAGKTVRIGSDDVDNLIRFLRSKARPSGD